MADRYEQGRERRYDRERFENDRGDWQNREGDRERQERGYGGFGGQSGYGRESQPRENWGGREGPYGGMYGSQLGYGSEGRGGYSGRENVSESNESRGVQTTESERNRGNWGQGQSWGGGMGTYSSGSGYGQGGYGGGMSSYGQGQTGYGSQINYGSQGSRHDMPLQGYGDQGYSSQGYGGQSYSGGQTGHHVGRGPKNYKRSDERIQEDINEHLTRHPAIDATEIEVTVTAGEVILRGTVNSRQEKRQAEDVAENVSGVRDVRNELRVQNTGQQHSGTGSTQAAGGASSSGATSTTTGAATSPKPGSKTT